MSDWKGAYVCHICKKCNCAFVAEDYTNAQDIPPHWRYCPDCAKELGIDYDSQTPKTNRTPEEQERIDRHMEKLKIIGAEKLKEYRNKKKQNL